MNETKYIHRETSNVRSIDNWRELEILEDGKAHNDGKTPNSVLNQDPEMGNFRSVDIVKSFSY